MHKALVAVSLSVILTASLCLLIFKPRERVGYSCEAQVIPGESDSSLFVEIKISRLTDKGEELVAQPRISTTQGCPANFGSEFEFNGEKHKLAAEVLWPYPKESGEASCVVSIKRAEQNEYLSKMQIKIHGPGRDPLTIHVQEVDPASVCVTNIGNHFVLLKLVGKDRLEVKKLADANYGNRVQIRDFEGVLVESGRWFGTYQEVGMSLGFEKEEDAVRVGRLLRREKAKQF